METVKARCTREGFDENEGNEMRYLCVPRRDEEQEENKIRLRRNFEASSLLSCRSVTRNGMGGRDKGYCPCPS